MASAVEHSIFIPKFEPVDVFEAGTLLESLPQEKGLTIESEAERFELGTQMKVGVEVGHHNFQIKNTTVVEFEPVEFVKIFGNSNIGSVAIELALSEYEDNDEKGTKVDYSILIKHAFFTRPVEPIIKAHLKDCLPRYAEKHKLKVLGILNNAEEVAA